MVTHPVIRPIQQGLILVKKWELVFSFWKSSCFLLILFSRVEKAVTALLKDVNTKEGKKLNPFDEHDNILLILALKKIPQKEKKPKRM